MGVELEPGQVERLLDLDRKFGKEGLTFDDVLLVPAESRVLPNEVSTATQLTRGITIVQPRGEAREKPRRARKPKHRR